MRTAILCPGSLVKTKEKIWSHYLMRIDESTTKLLCDDPLCKFMYRDEDGKDVWQDGFMPMAEKP